MTAKSRYFTGIGLVLLACLGLASAPGASVLGVLAPSLATRADTGLPSPTRLVAARSVEAFAQDGTRIAWLDSSKCARVLIRDLATGVTRPLVADARLTCSRVENADEAGYLLHDMALAGTRALWGVLAEYWGNEEEGWDKYVFTAAPGEKEHELNTWGGGIMCDHTEVDSCRFGDTTGLIVATDGDTALYVDEGNSDEFGGAPTASRVFQVDGKQSAVPSTRNALRIDAAQGRLAVLLNASGLRTVLIQRIASRKIEAKFSVSHGASELALDRSTVAVRILDKARSRVELRRMDGSKIRAIAVPRSAERFSLSGTSLVYSVAKQIYVLDSTTGKSSLIAKAVGPVAGLSIERNRVAWAELGRGIYSVVLRDS